MKLEKVVINNFRNIDHAEYDLNKINIFAGPNRKGKTNTILGIYWAITGYLLDGSSDHASFKPLDDTSKEVSVELEFDKIKIKKVFYENWVKNRGTNEESMSGHITDFYINDVKTKNSDATKAILEIFGLNNEYNTSKFDLLQAMINPYYISQLCNGPSWKEARKFIVQLIGDVSNDEVFEANPALINVKERLEKDKYDTAVTAAYYGSQIKGAKQNIEELQGKIKGLEDIKDINEDDYNIAKSSLEKANEQIYAIKNNDESSNHQMIIDLNKQLLELQNKYKSSSEDDRQTLDRLNKDSKEQVEIKMNELSNLNIASNEVNKKLVSEQNKLSALLSEINRLKLDLGNTERSKENLYKQYDEVYGREIVSKTVSIEERHCPNCGYVLNQNDLDQANTAAKMSLQKQESLKQEELASIIARGKAATLEIERLKVAIDDREKLEKPIEKNIESIRTEYNTLKDKETEISNAIENARQSIKYGYTSDKTSRLLIDIEKKNEEIKLITSSDSNNQDKLVKIAEINLQKEQYQKVINDRNAFLTAQEHIKKFEKELVNAGNEQMELEQKLLLVNEFTLTKLKMFDKHVSDVFGNRVKFTLIKNNIKEGSWNEVCYPSVLDKNTPFIQGSGSEQILTGIYLIECIRKKLDIGNLPYIFDEADKLDTKSLASIDTESQIITTKVDDINYKKVTLTGGNNDRNK